MTVLHFCTEHTSRTGGSAANRGGGWKEAHANGVREEDWDRGILASEVPRKVLETSGDYAQSRGTRDILWENCLL